LVFNSFISEEPKLMLNAAGLPFNSIKERHKVAIILFPVFEPSDQSYDVISVELQLKESFSQC